MNRFILVFLLGIGIVIKGHAQILNIEKARLDKDTSEYFGGNISADFSLFNRSAADDAPVTFLGLNTDVNLLYKKGNNNYIFITQFNYLKINENPFINTGFVHGRAHFLTDRFLSYEVFTQYQYDNFRQLNPRILLGATPRFRVLRNEVYTIFTGVGLMYEAEYWTHPHTNEIVPIRLAKSTNYVSFRAKFGEHFDMNGASYYQVGYDPAIGDARHRVNFILNILSRITRIMSFKFSFNIQWEDKPIIPITPLIYNISNGLIIQIH